MNKKIFNSRYEIGAMIGTGGMADVYIAEDLRLHRKVAVKILRSDLARDPAFIARFKKEALAIMPPWQKTQSDPSWAGDAEYHDKRIIYTDASLDSLWKSIEDCPFHLWSLHSG